MVIAVDLERKATKQTNKPSEYKALKWEVLLSKDTKRKKNVDIGDKSVIVHTSSESFILAHRIRYLKFYPGIENLILPMLSYPGCHAKAVHRLY